MCDVCDCVCGGEGLLTVGMLLQIGVQSDLEIADANPAEFARFMNVNVLGTFHVIRAASAIMRSQDPCAISPYPNRGANRGAIVTSARRRRSSRHQGWFSTRRPNTPSSA